MNDMELRKIIDQIADNRDSYFSEKVFDVVKKLLNLSENTETTISKLVDDSDRANLSFMFDIFETVVSVCKIIGVTLDMSKHDNHDIGLPFNIPFIKKTMSDELVNSIPQSLKEYVYIHNGHIYVKQKLPVELESEYESLIKKTKEKS